MDRAIVLVVEDNGATRRLVRAALAEEDWTIVEAEDGWSAIELAGRWRPDLVLQDLFLPDLDGLDLLEHLRSLPATANVPILAYSGWTSKLEEARRAGIGFTDFLAKPVEPTRLCATLRSYLGA